jgi:hypothetical protein
MVDDLARTWRRSADTSLSHPARTRRCGCCPCQLSWHGPRCGMTFLGTPSVGSIRTPNNAHRDIGRLAIGAGKDVRICHKLTAAKVCVPETT